MVALVLCLAGFVALTYGSWLVYEPAAFLVGGVLLIAAGVLYVRGTRVVP